MPCTRQNLERNCGSEKKFSKRNCAFYLFYLFFQTKLFILLKQGDQIGRVFAQWAIAYFLYKIFEHYRSSPRFVHKLLFHNYILCIHFDQKWFGLLFGLPSGHPVHKWAYIYVCFVSRSLVGKILSQKHCQK
jgi:hypothetical protein